MKFKYFNKELTKKVLAGTIAGIMTLSGIPGVVKAKSNNSQNTTTSISSNACYDKYIGEVDTLGGKFKIFKRENSVYAEHIGEKFTDKITVFNDGTVNTSITRRDKNGFSTTSTESFKINTYNGDYIDIDTNCINDLDVKKCLNSFKNYINGLSFNEINYIKELNYCPNREYYEKAQKQVKAAAQKIDYDIDKSQMKYGVVFVLPGESATLGTGEMLTFTGMLTASEVAMQNLKDLSTSYYNKSIIGTKISVSYLTLRLYMEIVAQNISKALDNLPKSNTSGYDEVDVINPSLKYEDVTGTINKENLNKITGYGVLSVAANEILKNSKDNNEDNDYYKACISELDNHLYIDYLHPISKVEAIQYLKKYKSFKYDSAEELMNLPANESPYELDIYNIYTPNQSDAKKLVESIGSGVLAGTRSKVGVPECHAFINSENLISSSVWSIPKFGLELNPKAVPGEYYWHYHIYKEKLLNDKYPGVDILGNAEKEYYKNEKHVFFGYPVIVTQNDIDKYAGRRKININDLDNHKTELISNKDFINSFDDYMNATKIKIKKK